MSPYVGDELAPLFRPGPTHAAAHDFAEILGAEWKAWTVKNTPIELGRLRRSWYTTPVSIGRHGTRTGWAGYLRTEVDYAQHVEHGTGIFGPQGHPYTIKPKKPGGVLTWIDKDTGERVFAKSVRHPGSPGQHMLAIGAVMADHHGGAACEARLRRWAIEQERIRV